MPTAEELHQFMASPLGASGTFTVSAGPMPDECPICHSRIMPRVLGHAFRGGHPGGRLQVVCQCTRRGCESLLVATYTHTEERSPVKNGHYALSGVEPQTPQEASFHEEIEEISPGFVEIYNQALAAESAGLDQLTGIGLRKALEFLIKDYASKEHPDNEEQIRKAPLARCIKDYVTDPNAKECAKRAVWLGNDETHYTRKWTNRDIKDLKLLTRLTVNWVENVLLTERYIRDMPET